MNQRLTQIIAQLRSMWESMPAGRRLLIVGATGVVFAALAILTFVLGNANHYEVLYSRLHAQDAAEVLQQLEESGIPYSLQQDLAGRAVISVPRDVVYRTRIELAAQGIPRQGSVGFEIFDETQLGMTDDVRRINLRRALNGELERTIRAMDVVDDARVQVAIPENKLFLSQQQKPTAAVMLTLRPGLRLAAEQVRAIQRLVGSTIEGLNPDDVFVVDNKGNPLSDQLSQLENASGMSAVEKQILIQQALSNEYSRQIRSMLEGLFGVGRVEVMATVQLNFESVEEVVKAFEAPNGRSGIVRSEQLYEESYSGAGQPPGGPPGVESNVPGYVGLTSAGESEYNRVESIINYEINEIQTRRQVPPGAIRSVSVGVWIDGELSDDQELGIANTLSTALGLDPGRGDQVIVDSMPFASVAALAGAPQQTADAAWGVPGPYALVAAALAAIIALMYWGLRRRRPIKPEGIDVVVDEEADVYERKPTAQERRRQQVREQVAALAREKPEDVAQLLKAWLMEE